MKYSDKRTIPALLAAGLLAANCTACGTQHTVCTVYAEDLMEDVAPQAVSGKAADDAFRNAQITFALALMQKTAEADRSSDHAQNLLLSPYSVMQALAMTANGAAGSTRSEMEGALGGIPVEMLNEYLYTLRTGQPDESGCKVKTANSVWYNNQAATFRPNRDFLQTNANYYSANAYARDFTENTVNDINSWVSTHTEKMIPEIVEKIDPDTVMYLVNAVSFDAKWMYPYEDITVSDAPFRDALGNQSNVKMMHSTESVWLHDDHADGFLKYYEGGRYAFAALLPEEGMTVEDYLAALTPEELLHTLSSYEYSTVYAGIPKFSADYTAEMKPILSDMGMTEAFTGQADFSRMGDAPEGLFISNVRHKTRIDVTETGTKAAAATAVEMKCGSALAENPKTVILDRPFLYFILDTETNLPIFFGMELSVNS